MNDQANGDLRAAVWKIYDFIQDGLYLNRPDLEIKGRRLNAALLLTLLTALGQGKELIICSEPYGVGDNWRQIANDSVRVW